MEKLKKLINITIMKTHLIVLTSLDELRAKKEYLVQKFSDDGNLKKHSDDSVETNDDQIFFLKVITISEYRTKLIQSINRGYDHVVIDSVRKEISDLVDLLDGAVVPVEHFGHLETKNLVDQAKEEESQLPQQKIDEDEDVDIRNNQ